MVWYILMFLAGFFGMMFVPPLIIGGDYYRSLKDWLSFWSMAIAVFVLLSFLYISIIYFIKEIFFV